MMKEFMIAAKWWADQLRSTPKQDNGDRFQSSLASLLASKHKRPAEAEIQAFEESLTEAMVHEWMSGQHEIGSLTVSVDYHPGAILMKASEMSGVDLAGGLLLPMKTMMRIRQGSVKVAVGYGASFVEIFAEHLASA